MHVLEVRNVTKKFGGVCAVNDCSFNIEENKINGLIGPNGAGKTTLFNIITGFIKADEGRIFIFGDDITGFKQNEIVRKGIARTFQMPRNFKNLTVMENLVLSYNNNYFSKKVDEKLVRKVVENLGLTEHLDQQAGNLSHGQQRLLEIGRALVRPFKILLLDEPTAGVNPRIVRTIREILIELKKEGKTVLLIEHNMEFVSGLCDETIVMDHGRKFVAGKTDKVLKDPTVLKAYLGA